MPELYERVMQSRLHRPQRAADNRCDLVQRRAPEEAQVDDQTMLFRQFRHRATSSQGVFAHLRRTIGRVPDTRRLVQADLIQKVWRRTAVAVLSSIDGVKCRVANSRTPRGDHRSVPRIAMLRPASLAPGPRPSGYPCKGRARTATGARVLFGQPLKRSCLARLGTIDQLSLVVFGCVHDIGDSPDPAKRFTCDKIFL